MKWTRIVKGENPLLKVYKSEDNDIKVDYPKASRWAQKAAMKIYNEGSKNGWPSKTGVRTIVKGLWAAMIEKAAK